MNPEVWDRIEATLDRTTALAEKNEKKLDRLEEGLDRLESGLDRLEKTTAERTTAIFDTLDRIAKEREIEAKKAAEEREIEAKKAAEEREKAAREREIAAKEHERMARERDESLTRLEKTVDKMCNAVSGVKEELKGISDSNGMVAEDYFYASLDESKTLGGVHFDRMLRNVTNGIKFDGKEINEEYDAVMYTDTSVCIVEVKYKVRKQDIRKLAMKRVQHFKMLFPMYANYKIYLAVGGMAFEKGAVDAAKELGMGVLQLNGDAVEIYDENLKVY